MPNSGQSPLTPTSSSKCQAPAASSPSRAAFQDAYECERLAVEQAQWDLILDEPKHAYEDKQEVGSGMP